MYNAEFGEEIYQRLLGMMVLSGKHDIEGVVRELFTRCDSVTNMRTRREIDTHMDNLHAERRKYVEGSLYDTYLLGATQALSWTRAPNAIMSYTTQISESKAKDLKEEPKMKTWLGKDGKWHDSPQDL